MSDVLIIIDGASASDNASSFTQVIDLLTVGKRRNVRLDTEVFRIRFLREMPQRLEDLLRLAACIYSADARVTRGSEKDVFALKWIRRFKIILPVWDLDYWKSDSVARNLTGIMQFLTGDEYAFDFKKRNIKETQQTIFEFKEQIYPLSQVDTVVSFSGGSDSLAAVLELVNEDRKPVLVSHRPAPVIDTRQKNLVGHLRRLFPKWSFPHLSMWVHRQQGRRSVEFTQRSRSFLFLSLAAVTANLLDINDVRLCDNGIVSINLPQSDQNIGTFLSRSTHPKYLSLAEVFMRDVTGRGDLNISNTLLFKTKKEVMDIIASKHPDLLQETISCHTEAKTKFQPHCGVCTQCIDRRFAGIAAGLEQHDLASRYEKDIFTSSLDNGISRTHAENYIRFAIKLESMQSPDEFFNAYPQLYDCLPERGNVDVFGQNLYDLFQRHQETVNGVLEKQIQAHLSEIRRALLPKNSLLHIVSSGEHAIDPKVR